MSKDLQKAVEILNSGGVVAIPTETVYGLAARIDNESAIKQIFSLKRRPSFDPLIVHIGNIKSAKSYVKNWFETAERLAEAFWPGPLTIVLKKQPIVSDSISAGLNTVGLRMPNNKKTLQLLQLINCPLAAPSANLFSKVSPTNPEHVRKDFPNLFVLEDGQTDLGIESTVVAINEENDLSILRPGMITKADILAKFPEVKIDCRNSQASPGNSEKHYQPNKPLYIFPENELSFDEFIDKFGLENQQGKELVLESSPQLTARILYSRLRDINTWEEDFAFVRKTDSNAIGLWESIWDRLNRAAEKLQH